MESVFVERLCLLGGGPFSLLLLMCNSYPGEDGGISLLAGSCIGFEGITTGYGGTVSVMLSLRPLIDLGLATGALGRFWFS